MESTNLRQLIEEILRDSREMILATCVDSMPWAVSLVFGHDEKFNLYWMSQENTRHSKELAKNPKVAVAINKQSTGGGKDKGLQIQGKASRLPKNKILAVAQKFFAKRGLKKLPQSLEEAQKMSEGRSWFALKPSKIYVIYAPLFGYGREEFKP